MDSIQILDASLRDGGHRTNFHFSNAAIDEILSALDMSGIEYIEIGYRNSALSPDEHLGKAASCDKEYLLHCRSLIKNATITVMAMPRDISKEDLNELRACGVGLLRLCINKNGLAEALPIIELAKQMDLLVSVNFINMTHYEDHELDSLLAKINPYQPDMIYFADSNGSIKPERVQAIYGKYTKIYSIPFGFHAHDNLGLAQANALAAIHSGAQLIDATLAGMGKGTGNLKTEFFVAYLHAIDVKKYDLNATLYAANYVRDALKIGHELLEIDEFIKGISDDAALSSKGSKIKY